MPAPPDTSLYWGFLPHCFEAWPHDISELLVYGSMMDFREEASDPRSRHHRRMQGIPPQAWDLTTGAAAGAAAVLVSMPFDCIKTHMQTHGCDLGGKGIFGSTRLFFKTGVKMVQAGGPGSL